MFLTIIGQLLFSFVSLTLTQGGLYLGKDSLSVNLRHFCFSRMIQKTTTAQCSTTCISSPASVNFLPFHQGQEIAQPLQARDEELLELRC